MKKYRLKTSVIVALLYLLTINFGLMIITTKLQDINTTYYFINSISIGILLYTFIKRLS